MIKAASAVWRKNLRKRMNEEATATKPKQIRGPGKKNTSTDGTQKRKVYTTHTHNIRGRRRVKRRRKHATNTETTKIEHEQRVRNKGLEEEGEEHDHGKWQDINRRHHAYNT